MARSKQTLRKGMNYNAAGAHRQGTPARFPGKPTGKAGRQLAIMSEDTEDSSSASTDETIETSEVSNQAVNPVPKVLQNAIRAGRRRRKVSGKARIMVRKPAAPGTTRRRYKPGVRALKEISFYQKEYGLLCSKMAVARLVRELCEKKDLRWQSSAVLALHEGFEAYLVALFEDCVLEAIHGRRITVMPKDMFIALKIRGEKDKYANCFKLPYNPKDNAPETGVTQEY